VPGVVLGARAAGPVGAGAAVRLPEGGRMIGRPSRLQAGCQLRLVLPLGQTTWWAS
jgi:hypothetical protein